MIKINLLPREMHRKRRMHRAPSLLWKLLKRMYFIEKRQKYARPRQDVPRLIRVNLLPREMRQTGRMHREPSLLWKLLKRAHFLVATVAILGVICAMIYDFSRWSQKQTPAWSEKHEDSELREIEAKNRYLQDPAKDIERANAILQEAQSRLESGTLKLPPQERILQDADDAMKSLKKLAALRGIEISKAPDYLNVLFRIALQNQPRQGAASGANFRLFVCHGLENDCNGTYSIPNGIVVISFEAIAFMQSEAELVAVMGHEIGHTTNEDSRKEIGVREFLDKENQNIAVNKLRGTFFWKLSLADQEREDVAALETIERAGYSPCAAEDFAKHFVGIEAERVRALATILKGRKCGGPVFKIKNEAGFRAFKQEFLRIKPRPLWDSILDLEKSQ